MRLIWVAALLGLSCAGGGAATKEGESLPTANYRVLWHKERVFLVTEKVVVTETRLNFFEAFSLLAPEQPLWFWDTRYECETLIQEDSPEMAYTTHGEFPTVKRLEPKCVPLSNPERLIPVQICRTWLLLDLETGDALMISGGGNRARPPFTLRGVEVVQAGDGWELSVGEQTVVVSRVFEVDETLYTMREVGDSVWLERVIGVQGKIRRETVLVAPSRFLTAEVGRLNDDFVLVMPDAYVSERRGMVEIVPPLEEEISLTVGGVLTHAEGMTTWYATDLFFGAERLREFKALRCAIGPP